MVADMILTRTELDEEMQRPWGLVGVGVADAPFPGAGLRASDFYIPKSAQPSRPTQRGEGGSSISPRRTADPVLTFLILAGNFALLGAFVAGALVLLHFLRS